MKKLLALFMAFMMTLAMASGLEKITPVEAQKMLAAKTSIIVDVREPAETKLGMVKDALTVPLSLMKDKNEEW
jgi:rhodanese-related sulfurtransferase